MGAGKRRSDIAGRAKMRSPGRPPVLHRSQRRPFWRAIAAGCSSEDAARRVGLSPVVGARWFRECGGMPPSQLAPSAPAPTGRYLSLVEREQIALLRVQRQGIREIARQLARSASTISRELRRNAASRRRRLGVSRDSCAVAFRSRGATSQACQIGAQCCIEGVCRRPTGRQGRHAGGQVGGCPYGGLEGTPARTAKASTVGACMEPGTDLSPPADRFPGRYFNAH